MAAQRIPAPSSEQRDGEDASDSVATPSAEAVETQNAKGIAIPDSTGVATQNGKKVIASACCGSLLGDAAFAMQGIH